MKSAEGKDIFRVAKLNYNLPDTTHFFDWTDTHLPVLQVQSPLQVFVNDSVHQNLPVVKDHSVQTV